MSNRRPQNLDEFGCWLNNWADESAEARTDREARIYQRAVSDVLREFDRLHPGWLAAWPEWSKQSASVA